MNDYIYKLELDLNCRSSAPQISSGQFDKGRKIEIKILSNGTEFNLANCTATLKGVRRDNTSFALPCTVNSNTNRVIAEIDDTTFSVSGFTVAKIVLSDSDKSFSTQVFTILVNGSLDGDITKDNNYSVLNRLIEQVHMLDENGAVRIGDGTITASKLAANAVTTSNIKDKSVTLTKLSEDIFTNNISGGNTGLVRSTDIYLALNKKSDKATTLSGYGITDAYTKNEVDSLLAENGSGGGVVSYPKNEIDSKLLAKVDTSSIISQFDETLTDIQKIPTAVGIMNFLSDYYYGINETYSSDEIDDLLSAIGEGKDGQDGKSAYQIAVDNGFEGTQAQWLASIAQGAPDYVLSEAEAVANKIIETRTANSFVFLAAADTHVVANEANRASIRQMGQGMTAIRKHITLDSVVLFGDYSYDMSPPSKSQGIDDMKYTRECVNDATVGLPTVWMDGNHDHYKTSGENRLTDNENYTLVGAHNSREAEVDVNNPVRNYGYIDFKKQRIRLIYLNTTDISGGVVSSNYISDAQYQWLVNTALNMNDKADANKWGILVCSHFPIYAQQISTGTKVFPALETIICAYKDKTNGTVSGISYDFTTATAELIATFHGHIHNFKVTATGKIVKAIAIPNACINRENPYGGVFQETDESGNPVFYSKTVNSRESTSFNAIVIDRDSKTIHAFCYGAGYDRVIDYADSEAIVSVNQIPLSTDASGAVYNGVGYKDGVRIGSDGTDRTEATVDATGFIPCTTSDTLYFKNCRIVVNTVGTGEGTYQRIVCYDAGKNYIGLRAVDIAGQVIGKDYDVDANNNLTRWNCIDLSVNTAFVRITGNYIGAESVITVNQPIE